MKRYEFFNAQRPNVEDMNFISINSNENIREAIGLHLTNGIIRAAESLTLGELQKKIQFPTFTQNLSDTGKLDILLTAGYIVVGLNRKGYPVIIQTNEIWQTTDPNKSSGNYAIPFPGDGTYYIWMDYYETTDTGVSRTNKYGTIFSPLKDDGYIIVVDTAGPTIPPSSNPDAIYLGEVVVAAGVVDPGQFDQITSVEFAGVKPQNVFVEIDESNKTAVYEDGKIVGLDEHVNAIGEYPVSPDNPHGIHPNDIKAVDAVKFSQIGASVSDRIGLMRNGIVMFSDQAQNIMNAPPPAIINAPPTQWYVELSAPLTGWNFAYDGRIFSYDAGEIHVVDTLDNKVKVYFTPGSDVEGWYAIHLSKANPTDEFLTLEKTLTFSPGLYASPNDTRILLGYVFWKNTSPTIQLQLNERDMTPVNGTTIFKTPSMGSFNQSKFAEVRARKENGLATKNIIPNGGFKYGTPIINGKINGVMNITGANYNVVTDGASSFNKALRLDNINSGATLDITMPQYINNNENPTFVFSFAVKQILPSGGYMKLTMGSGTYILPDQQNYRQNFQFDAFSLTPGSLAIRIEFLNTTADASNYVEFDNFQLIKSNCHQPNLIMDDITASEIFYDSQNTTDTRDIKDEPLTEIVTKIPISTQVQNVGSPGAITGPGFYSGTDPNNMEMWCVRSKITYNSGLAKYVSGFSWDPIKYALVSVTFAAPGEEWKVTSGVGVQPNQYGSWSLFTGSNNVSIRSSHSSYSLTNGNTCFWTAIMKRL